MEEKDVSLFSQHERMKYRANGNLFINKGKDGIATNSTSGSLDYVTSPRSLASRVLAI